MASIASRSFGRRVEKARGDHHLNNATIAICLIDRRDYDLALERIIARCAEDAQP
jgi:hypothetical protein